MDLSTTNTQQQEETVWDLISQGVDNTLTFLSQIWLFICLSIHRITKFDILSLEYVRDLLESLVVHFYLILSAFCASAKDFFEVVYEYLSKNSSVCAESALLMSSMYLFIGVFTFFYYTQFGALTLTNTTKERKRVLVAIAHPVDGVLYFGPTILKLKDSCDVKILCFGSGNGLEEYMQRKNELYKSCEVLGVPVSNITIMRNTVMPTDFDVLWDVAIVSRMLLDYIEVYAINEVYTFDIDGVSGNANHTSLFFAAARLSLKEQIPEYCKIYTIESINKVRIYSGFLDAAVSSLPLCHRTFLVNLDQALTIKKAMKLHDMPSWYSRFSIFFYRYLYINTYREIDNDDLYLQLNDHSLLKH